MRYLEDGGAANELQKILGHASLETTSRYVDHVDTEALAESMPDVPQ